MPLASSGRRQWILTGRMTKEETGTAYHTRRDGRVFKSVKIMVSACLLGVNCKYNGGSNRNEALLKKLAGHEVIPVCPETAGGLPTPRIPAEIVNGTVLNREGRNVDAEFRAGADAVLELARREQPDLLILQSRSPSCGVKEIYDGTFRGRRIPGQGIFAGLAQKAGFAVKDVEDFLREERA